MDPQLFVPRWQGYVHVWLVLWLPYKTKSAFLLTLVKGEHHLPLLHLTCVHSITMVNFFFLLSPDSLSFLSIFFPFLCNSPATPWPQPWQLQSLGELGGGGWAKRSMVNCKVCCSGEEGLKRVALLLASPCVAENWA